MRTTGMISCFLLCLSYLSQSQPLPSKVFTLNNSVSVSTRNGNTKKLFSGSGAILSLHEMYLVTLLKGKSLSYKADASERFFIIKNGPVKVTLNDNTAVLDRGSVMLVLPGDKIIIENTAEKAAGYYERDDKSIATPDRERGKKACISFMRNWNDMVFKPTDKGGVRQLFDRQTTMLNRFDIHVTQLNEGFKSHDPHTHKNEEIILMMEGNAEMQIGTDHQKANAGDAVFLVSMVLHNLSNIGKIPCLYFAIQWN